MKKPIYGCMGLGGSWTRDPLSTEEQKKGETVIEAVLENGITHFDHADIYALGKAEEVFGNFLKQHASLREKLFIQSKTGIELHAGVFNSSRYNLSQDYVLNQVDSILKRLSTDYLDALLLHRPDPLTSMEELAETLHLLKKSGKVNSFGVSNMSVSQIIRLQKYLNEPLIGNQIKLSLDHSILIDLEVWVNREESPKEAGLSDLLNYSNQHNLCIQAYSPLAQGKFSLAAKMTENHRKTAALLNSLAEKYQTTQTALLLAWVWKIPANIQPIIGTTDLQRIQDSAKAGQIDLSREDWYDLWISSKGKILP